MWKQYLSTIHQTIKFSTLWGSTWDQTRKREFTFMLSNYLEKERSTFIATTEPTYGTPQWRTRGWTTRCGYASRKRPWQNVNVSSKLLTDVRKRLIDFLMSNAVCFTWSHADMPGIYPKIIMHKLQVDWEHQPVRKNRRKYAHKHDLIIHNEV